MGEFLPPDRDLCRDPVRADVCGDLHRGGADYETGWPCAQDVRKPHAHPFHLRSGHRLGGSDSDRDTDACGDPVGVGGPPQRWICPHQGPIHAAAASGTDRRCARLGLASPRAVGQLPAVCGYRFRAAAGDDWGSERIGTRQRLAPRGRHPERMGHRRVSDPEQGYTPPALAGC